MMRPSGGASTRGIATDFVLAVKTENMPERAEEHDHKGQSCWSPSTIQIIKN